MRKVLQATVFSICATPFFSNCGQPAQDRFHFPFLDGEGFRGKAEIAVYEGTGLESGQGLPAELTLVTVLESINPVQRVKTGTNTADSWPGVKQNQILSFQSGAKSYRSMNSLFWRKQDGGLLRASMTWQEPGGTTAKTLLPQGGVDRMNYHSFWENEADGE
ncbi:MAG: hypothetical protein K8S54_02330, partial [Spirochaetia bacterium]|nr:hypothetical protein [Spirochaetia bacterium]